MIVKVKIRLDYDMKDRKGDWSGWKIVIEEFKKKENERLEWGKDVW